MRLLITGGAGFIGSNLARYALATGDEVLIVDDFSTGRRTNIDGLDVTLFEGSLLDRPLLDEAVRMADAIVHLAAIPSVPRSIAHPLQSHNVNATGTLNLLEAARGADVSHISVASSSSVYGANPKLPKNELDYTRPMSPYAVSKAATEGYALAYHYSYGLPAFAFRLFNVYGPGQPADHAYAAVIPRFLDAALRGEPVQIHGDGLQSRDFTYVQTVCAILHRAAHRRIVSPEPVNLAFQTNTTLLELLALMECQLGTHIRRSHVSPRTGDVKASQADCSRLTTLFSDVEPTPLTEGLTATIEWMEKQI